jgi:hypothetical protein
MKIMVGPRNKSEGWETLLLKHKYKNIHYHKLSDTYMIINLPGLQDLESLAFNFFSLVAKTIPFDIRHKTEM